MLFAARNREAGVSTKDLAEIIYENLVGRLADSPLNPKARPLLL
jgi:hypothetical protein